MPMVRVLFVLVLLFAVAGAAFADTVVLSPMRDNTLYEDADGDLSNGAGFRIFAGVTVIGEIRRAVMAFDLEGAIPKGSEITGVTLTLRMSRTVADSHEFALHRLEASWGEGDSLAGRGEGGGAPSAEGDATWIHRFYPRVLWDTPGGDFEPSASAVTEVGFFGSYTWGSTPQMIADVESWIADPASNHGWILIGDESVAPTAKRFESREFTDFAPRLTIDFDPPTVMERFEPRGTRVVFAADGADRAAFAARYELGAGSDGLDPENETLTLTIGSASLELPPGSFSCDAAGVCLFSSTGPGIVEALVSDEIVAFRVEGVNLAGTTNPVELTLLLGDDIGDTTIRLQGTLAQPEGVVVPGHGPRSRLRSR